EGRAAPEYEREGLTARSEMDPAFIPEANREAEWHVPEDAVEDHPRGACRFHLLHDLHPREDVASASNTETTNLWRVVPERGGARHSIGLILTTQAPDPRPPTIPSSSTGPYSPKCSLREIRFA